MKSEWCVHLSVHNPLNYCIVLYYRAALDQNHTPIRHPNLPQAQNKRSVCFLAYHKSLSHRINKAPALVTLLVGIHSSEINSCLWEAHRVHWALYFTSLNPSPLRLTFCSDKHPTEIERVPPTAPLQPHIWRWRLIWCGCASQTIVDSVQFVLLLQQTNNNVSIYFMCWLSEKADFLRGTSSSNKDGQTRPFIKVHLHCKKWILKEQN